MIARTSTNQRRMLNRQEAADYCGIPASRFVAVCNVPVVMLSDKDKRYDINDLDAWLDGLKGLSLDDDSILAKLRKAS